ncbi:MAG: hypothetical protein WCJ25_05620 [Candidatus Moraniibacteriota bacterium]
MKANIVGVGAVVTAAVMLAGCGSAPVTPSADQSQSPTQASLPAPSGGGIAEWASGLASGKKMQCTYEMGGTADKPLSVKMFADKSHYRTETVTPAGTMISISDGTAMYTWTAGTKQGMKMDFECAKGLQSNLPKDAAGAPQSSYSSPEDAVKNIPNIACSESSDPVDFSVPSDVTFVDQCALLKHSLDAAKNAQSQIPDSVKNLMK